MNHIKYSFILFGIMFIFGCQPETDRLPNSAEELRTLQKKTRTEIRDLEKKLAQIEQKMDSLSGDKKKQYPMVTIDTLIASDFNHYVEVQGLVESQDQVSASSEIGGIITQLMVREGDRVREGQVIAKVDVESIQKQLEQLETQLDFAKDVYQKQKNLWEQNIGSEVQYLEAKNAVDNLEKNYESLQVNLRKANVYAPKTGVVDNLIAKAGEVVGPGTPIAQIIDDRKLQVLLEVPENYLGKIKEGEIMDLKFPSLKESYKGLVSRIGATINRANRTFLVEVKIQRDASRLIRPNMLAIGLINDYSRENVIQIPVNLVQQEVNGKDYVLLLGTADEGKVAVKQYVKVGKVAENNVLIEDGLKPGQLILVDGARGLSDKQFVEIR